MYLPVISHWCRLPGIRAICYSSIQYPVSIIPNSAFHVSHSEYPAPDPQYPSYIGCHLHHKLLLTPHSRPGLPNLTIVVYKQEGDSEDVEPGCRVWAPTDIQFTDPDLSFGIGGELIDDRTDRRTGRS